MSEYQTSKMCLKKLAFNLNELSKTIWQHIGMYCRETLLLNLQPDPLVNYSRHAF